VSESRPAGEEGSTLRPVETNTRPEPKLPGGREPARSGLEELLQGATQAIGRILGATTVLTALLYYFGWARTRTIFSYFAVDQSTLGFSTVTYLLYSAGTVISLLVIILVVALLLVAGQLLLARTIRATASPSLPLRLLVVVMAVAGTILCLHGFANLVPHAVLRPILTLLAPALLLTLLALWVAVVSQPLVHVLGHKPRRMFQVVAVLVGLLVVALFIWRAAALARQIGAWEFVLAPLSIGGGVALISFAVHTGQQVRAGGYVPDNNDARVPWLSTAAATMVVLLLALCLMWAVGVYAAATGATTAYQMALRLDRQTSVIVYTSKRLSIDAPGVHETTLNGTDASSAYKFRYTGLRLLAQARGKYYLLPDEWSADHPVTIVLPESEIARVDLVLGSRS
jgi:hypothetical protein